MNAIASEICPQKRLHDEYAKRWDRLQRCKNSLELQALVLQHCKADILYWINQWVWTYDPRRRPAMIPFLLFPKQEEYLLWRMDRRQGQENGITEKSRDMGVSWLNICHQVHCWMFEEGYKGAFGSRKEDLVDKIGDPDSLFEKIRLLLHHLPAWMLPTGFSWDDHDNFLKLINPSNGSTLTGESGDNIGRGGRSSLYDLDEAAFIERAHRVDAALSNNTNVIFYTSSANGIGNLFYKKRFSYPTACVFRFHWRDDPRKDDAWYAQMKVKFDPVTVASEIDIDYGASVEGIYIPAAWVQAAIGLQLPVNGEQTAGLDVATTGSNHNVLIFRHGAVVQSIDAWQGMNTTETAFKAREAIEQQSFKHLTFDSDGVGAGVAGTLGTTPGLKFTFHAFHGSGSPSDRVWVGEGKTSKEKFHNARAEAWGLAHERFKKTFDHVAGLATYPLDELISIPNHPQLVAQLSQPKRKFTSAGKLLIESKDEMRSRGLESPDYADALVLAFLSAIKKQPAPIAQATANSTNSAKSLRQTF